MKDVGLEIVNKGRFVVFEGIDGSGKTTQVELLCKRLALTGSTEIGRASGRERV